MPPMPVREIPEKIDAVIFDMDGLIFDTERPIRRVVLDAARAVGFEMPEAFYQTMVGVPGPECDLLVKAHFGAGFPFDAYDDACRSGIARVLGEGVSVKARFRCGACLPRSHGCYEAGSLSRGLTSFPCSLHR